jgi:hypothetical protein
MRCFYVGLEITPGVGVCKVGAWAGRGVVGRSSAPRQIMAGGRFDNCSCIILISDMTAMDGGNASNAGAITCPCHDRQIALIAKPAT